MNQYLLLVSVHLKEEYEARKKKEDLGWFLICVYKNTAEEHAQIPLYSNELWKTAEAVGERGSQQGQRSKSRNENYFQYQSRINGKTISRIRYPVNELYSYRGQVKTKG